MGIARLINVVDESLVYDIKYLDIEKGNVLLIDPDSGEQFRFCPGKTKKEFETNVKRLGYRIEYAADDP